MTFYYCLHLVQMFSVCPIKHDTKKRKEKCVREAFQIVIHSFGALSACCVDDAVWEVKLHYSFPMQHSLLPRAYNGDSSVVPRPTP